MRRLSVGRRKIKLSVCLISSLLVPLTVTPDATAEGSGGHHGCPVNYITVAANEVISVSSDSDNQASVAVAGTECKDVISVYGSVYLAGTFDGQASAQADHHSKHNKQKKKTVPFALTGVASKGNDDEIINDGLIDVSITTTLDEPGKSNAVSSGISGGSGDDRVRNNGTINVQSGATVTTSDIELELIDSDSFGSEAVANAVGITGDSGSDDIRNTGGITVGAAANINAGAYSFSVAGGSSEVEAANSAVSSSIGIDAGEDDDDIHNSGSILSTATSTVSSVNAELNLIDTTHGDTSTHIDSQSTGIAGSDDDEWINNTGSVTSRATSSATAVAVEINAIDAATANGATNINSSATGITLGSGHDMLTGSGAITAESVSELLEVGVNASFLDITIADREAGVLSTSLDAKSLGVSGGKGDDIVHLSASGSLDATATSDVYSLGVALASEGVPASTEPLILEQSLASIGITGTTNSTGIDTGSGDDQLISLADLTIAATSAARQDSINVGIALINFKIPTPGIVIGSAGTQADATANGLITGDGDDSVFNKGLLDVDSDASATATTVSINLAEFSTDFFPDTSIPVLGDLGASLVAADTITLANSTALGIGGGDGKDRLFNSGAVLIDADAHSGSTSASASLNMKYKEGDNLLALDALFARAVTEANASATGISGDDDDDTISNTGTLTVGSQADTNSVTVAVDVAGTIQGKGGAIGLTATDTSNTATAASTGITGGEGHNDIENLGDLTVTSLAEADSVNVSTTIGIAEKGVVVGVALARAENNAVADSVGVDMGEDYDSFQNDGNINSDATALADATAVSATIAGTTRGLAVGVSLLDAGTEAAATAVGVQAGNLSDTDQNDKKKNHGHDGKDKNRSLINNTGGITVNANANTDSIAIGANIGIAEKGVALGVALADTSATSSASAKGITADNNKNIIFNDGAIHLNSDADADAISVALTIEGTATGVAGGAALTNSSVNTSSGVVGIEAGAGDDTVVNNGMIQSGSVQSTATAIGISPSVIIAKQGVAIGVALADTSATARSNATVIDIGQGDDYVANTGQIDLQDINANADAVAVSLALAAGSQGVALGGAAARSDATAVTTVQAVNGGKGDDEILNQGEITLGQIGADADAVSVALGITGVSSGVAINAALVDADASAETNVSVFSGGEGDDLLSNENSISVDGIQSETVAVGVGVSFSFANQGLAIGAALAETGTYSSVIARVLDGGHGNDALCNYGDISISNILAGADAVTVSAGLAGAGSGVAVGAGLADASGMAEAVATALDGGDGDDELINTGEILIDNVNADALAAGASLALTGANAGVAAGFTLVDTSATAKTNAFGMSGGSGEDEIVNNNTITMQNISADGVSVSASVGISAVLSGGVAGGLALADASATAETNVAGIDGGFKDDHIINYGDITIDNVESNIDSVGVSAQIGISNAGVALGGAVVDTSATANTNVYALMGGEGDDYILNEGNLTTNNLSAEADAVSVGVTINGAIQGGVAAGISLTDGAGNANIFSSVLDGGDGDDTLINRGMIQAQNVESNAHAAGVSVSMQAGFAGVVLGAALADTSANALTDVKGLSGGAGKDTLYNNEGAIIDVAGRSIADALSVGVSVGGTIGVGGGIQVTDASTTAESMVMGIDGGADRDEIVNKGSITSNAESLTEANAISVGVTIAVGGDATFADARSTATATAVGINSGEDEIDSGQHWNSHHKPDKGHHYGHGSNPQQDNNNRHNDDKYNKKKNSPPTVIVNSGEITAIAITDSDGMGVSGNLLGFALGETTNTSDAYATAILSDSGKDQILNTGSLTANSDASASGLSIAVNLGGATMGDSSTMANGIATSINSGAGDDEIQNEGVIDVDARSNASASQVTAGLIGAAIADASTTAVADVTGIHAGDGNDTIVNTAMIDVSAGNPDVADNGTGCSAAAGGACARSSSVSFQLGGFASIDASTTAHGLATGINGGAGNDVIQSSDSVINASAHAKTGSSGVSIGLLGANSTDARTLADAQANGIAGDLGDDLIVSSSIINSSSSSDIVISATSFGLAGAGGLDATLNAGSAASGISGGDGLDEIQNSGALNVNTRSRLASSGDSIIVFGAASSDSQSGASTHALAIDGGAQADKIWNTGNVTSASTAQLVLSRSSFAFGGVGGADGELSASTYSAGIGGGGGEDYVKNEGVLDVDATSILSSGGGSTVIFGSSGSDAASGALTNAVGVDAGEDNDQLWNLGRIDVDSNASLSMDNSSFNFGGAGGTEGSLSATTRSTGMAGGGGNDEILNEAEVFVDAGSSLNSSGSSDVAFGASGASATSGAFTHSIGLDGGSGDDIIWNKAKVDVGSNSSLTLSNSSYTFGGTGNVGGSLQAGTNSIAIAGGSGKDSILNEGQLVVDANSSLTSSGRVNTTFGTSAGGALVATDTGATGIDAGDDDDVVENHGDIRVNTNTSASSGSSSYVFGGGSSNQSTVKASTRSTGIDGGNGADSILNTALIEVLASSSMNGSGSAYAEFGGSQTSGLVTSEANLYGVVGGNGADAIVNQGVIRLNGSTGASSSHSTDTGFLFGDGDARARASAILNGYGIDAGAGNNMVTNEQDIFLQLTSSANTDSYSDGADIADGDATSRSDSISGTTGVGIFTLDGNDIISNSGRINIQTWREIVIPFPEPIGDIVIEFSSSSDASATADGDGIDGDGTGRAFATTSVWTAGIYAGHGNNNVSNTGSIVLDTRSRAVTSLSVDSDAGGSSTRDERAFVTVDAYGIYTGNGDDMIVNDGSINVAARASNSTGSGDVSATATGIYSGAGNDTVINNGVITATRVINGSTSSGTPVSTTATRRTISAAAGTESSGKGVGEYFGLAIDTGNGSDVVVLPKNSLIDGDIQLGSSDDMLHVTGSSEVTGTVFGGSDRDTVLFDGEGTFASWFSGVENAVKQGEGTFTLSRFGSMQNIAVEEGILRVDGDYTFNLDGSFVPSVSSNQHGAFEVTGTVMLAGDIKVIRGRGHHLDGDTLDVLTANGGFLENTAFDDIIMPEDAPLLRFSYGIDSNTLKIYTEVDPFVTVAASGNETAVAGYLDKVLYYASGDTSVMLGEIQAMQAGEHSSAYTNLSPESYSKFNMVTTSLSQQYIDSIQSRLNSIHFSDISAATKSWRPRSRSGSSEVDTSYVYGQLLDTTEADQVTGVWLKSFSQSGERDDITGDDNYDFTTRGFTLGYDGRVSDKLVVGFSAGSADNSVGDVNNRSRGDIESNLFSAYGSYIGERAYFDALFAYGQNEYTIRRDAIVAEFSDRLESVHDSRLTATVMNGGYYFRLNQRNWLEPYASLQYMRLQEDGFRETGGVTALDIESQTTDALLSFVGTRYQYSLGKSSGQLNAEFSLAWLHDYEIDDHSITASFTGDSRSAFTVDAQSLDPNGALFTAGIAYEGYKGFTSSIRYVQEVRGNYQTSSIVGALQFGF